VSAEYKEKADYEDVINWSKIGINEAAWLMQDRHKNAENVLIMSPILLNNNNAYA